MHASAIFSARCQVNFPVNQIANIQVYDLRQTGRNVVGFKSVLVPRARVIRVDDDENGDQLIAVFGRCSTYDPRGWNMAKWRGECLAVDASPWRLWEASQAVFFSSLFNTYFPSGAYERN